MLTSDVAKTIYICYFGVREPLVQTQVLPYLRELRKGISVNAGAPEANGFFPLGRRDGGSESSTSPRENDFRELDVTLLTFEPHLDFDTAATRSELANLGINWRWLKYHKRPSAVATAYDVLRGAVFLKRFIDRERPDILHGRVHVPTLIGAVGRKLSRHKPKLLFDIRGFIPEEYADAGLWPENGWLFRLAKRVESRLMEEADGFVVLTERARDVLFPESKRTGIDRRGRPVEVIPCCIDPDRFADLKGTGAGDEVTREKLGLSGRRVVVHLGALGGLYLTEKIVDFMAVMREVDARTFAMFLTQSDPGTVVPLLEAQGFTESDYLVTKVAPRDVPQYLCVADLALSFVRAGYATLSRSPTKIPEYLASGLPVVANPGVGDVDELIKAYRTGALLEDFSRESYLKALQEIDALTDSHQRCRETALRTFDLDEVGGKRYRQLYSKLLNQ